MTIALIIAGIALIGAFIAFSVWVIRKVSSLYDKVIIYQDKYQEEFKLVNKLAGDGIKLADENQRLKDSLTTMRSQYEELLKNTKFTDPGAAISNELRGFKPPRP